MIGTLFTGSITFRSDDQKVAYPLPFAFVTINLLFLTLSFAALLGATPSASGADAFDMAKYSALAFGLSALGTFIILIYVANAFIHIALHERRR